MTKRVTKCGMEISFFSCDHQGICIKHESNVLRASLTSFKVHDTKIGKGKTAIITNCFSFEVNALCRCRNVWQFVKQSERSPFWLLPLNSENVCFTLKDLHFQYSVSINQGFRFRFQIRNEPFLLPSTYVTVFWSWCYDFRSKSIHLGCFL